MVSDTAIAGSGRRRLEELCSVRIGDEVKVFASVQAAIAYIESLRAPEVKKAKRKAREDAKRIVGIGNAAKVMPPAPKVAISGPQESVDVIAFLQSKVDIAYYRALAEEMAKIAKEDEDIAMLVSVL